MQDNKVGVDEERADLIQRTPDVDVVSVPRGGPIEQLEKFADEAPRRVEALRKIRMAVLKLTSKLDWVDFGGKPYLMGSGAEKVSQIGVSMTDVRGWREDHDDDAGAYYVWKFKALFECAGRLLEAVGNCSSRDQFFAATAEEEKLWKQHSEIDQNDIEKAAYTNCLVNGVTRILGLRNMTWDELEAHGVLAQDDVSKVDFKTGGKGGTPKNVAEKRTRLWEICMELGENDPLQAKAMLKTLSVFKGKEGEDVFRDDVDKLTGKWLNNTLKKAEERLEKHRSSAPSDEAPPPQDEEAQPPQLHKDELPF